MSACLKVSKVFVASYVQNVATILKTSLTSVVGDVIVIKELPLSTNPNDFTKVLDAQASEIEYLFAEPTFIGQTLLHPRNNLKWAQCTFAGLDSIFKAVEKLQKIPDVIISRQTSGFGQTIGEYVIGHIIARERKFDMVKKLQQQKLFDSSQVMLYRSLESLSIGILGLGNIGQEVARQCKAMNMKVWAAVRDESFESGKHPCEHVDHFVPMFDLGEMLSEVDYLVNILPSTTKTRGLLVDKLQFCEKKKTVFINIGRGDIIDDQSLITSLQKGWLGGAILDVFNTEPLPSSSELWDLPDVTITPHISGVTFAKKAVETFLTNLKLYQEGKPLLNQVDLLRGY